METLRNLGLEKLSKIADVFDVVSASSPRNTQYRCIESGYLLEAMVYICITQCLTMQEFFDAGRYIIREGEVGDTFYIITEGHVKITQRILGQDAPKEIRQLGRGNFFGERALLNEDRRTASVIATDTGVELLTLNRE